MTEKKIINDENLEEISGGRVNPRMSTYAVGDFVVPDRGIMGAPEVYEITEPGEFFSKGYRHSVRHSRNSGYEGYQKEYVENIPSRLRKCPKPDWIPE